MGRESREQGVLRGCGSRLPVPGPSVDEPSLSGRPGVDKDSEGDFRGRVRGPPTESGTRCGVLQEGVAGPHLCEEGRRVPLFQLRKVFVGNDPLISFCFVYRFVSFHLLLSIQDPPTDPCGPGSLRGTERVGPSPGTGPFYLVS